MLMQQGIQDLLLLKRDMMEALRGRDLGVCVVKKLGFLGKSLGGTGLGVRLGSLIPRLRGS